VRSNAVVAAIREPVSGGRGKGYGDGIRTAHRTGWGVGGSFGSRRGGGEFTADCAGGPIRFRVEIVIVDVVVKFLERVDRLIARFSRWFDNWRGVRLVRELRTRYLREQFGW
jgi:hypothetical protein